MKNLFWMLYKQIPRKERKEFVRQHFWGWMMYHMPRLYKWCDKHLPWDTLPF